MTRPGPSPRSRRLALFLPDRVGGFGRPGCPSAGEIRSDDTARTETGPIRAKSYHTRQLVRDDLSDPPREGTGGHRPEGVLGVSPARRMQCDPIAPTRREDSARRIADP